jgi:hypothetical protein
MAPISDTSIALVKGLSAPDLASASFMIGSGPNDG